MGCVRWFTHTLKKSPLRPFRGPHIRRFSPGWRKRGEAGDKIFLNLPKPAEPEPNRDFERAPPSAVRAILDDLPIHIRPNLPAARVQT